MLKKGCFLLAWSISLPALADLSIGAGYTFGGEMTDLDTEETYSVRSAPSYMAAFDFATTSGENRKRETYDNYVGALVSWQNTEMNDNANTDVDVLYAHLTASRRWQYENFETFASGGAGLTHFAASPGSDTQRFSISIGGGYFYHLTENLDLKLEGRLYGTFVNDGTKIECGPGCQVTFVGGYWSQLGLNMGLNYRF
ncbi:MULTISPECIES: hypothetical protein [unclassified Agarivorans]|uniref:hypothetical protein n=1 Tax=unclassified Agarivorans TaxID=2636026 RepID=UPI0010E6BD47|nr:MULTISPECIES: hypothetical protein [unclassified Agarivorans]MDO6764838.1 hypothetical protein [Agarivorans sp. 1_MG-2023]GDY25218.1 hypothetical protein AHAT_11080 [Agarivorans sp. Toyoura001]